MWRSLPKPFFVLAPMANVTDSVFRKLIAKYSGMGKKGKAGSMRGGPDVMWTEFVSADGLASAGRARLLHDLAFSKAERPIVAQLFTGHPEAMRIAAKLAAELGFDGIDINMGCPDRAVEKQGGGAAHIKDPKTARAVIEAARAGVENGMKEKSKKGKIIIPVSVKTRIGYSTIDFNWVGALLKIRPPLPALTLHLRTRKEMSDVPAHWELMPEMLGLRDSLQTDLPVEERTLIIGNGDVVSMADARAKAKRYACDGIMIGRGIFGSPWFFSSDQRERTPEERLKIMIEHAKLFEKTFCPADGRGKKSPERLKNFAVMKKHFKAYVSGWDGAKELRVKLMETENAKEVAKIMKEYLS